MPKINVYRIPAAGEARERLRQRGQFWTPDWIAEAMVDYALADDGGALFDPAVGAGAFLRAAKTIARERGFAITLAGMDIDPSVLEQAIQTGLDVSDLAGVKISDFVFDPPQTKLPAIVANPPYIRHHRLSASVKQDLKRFSERTLGKALDGRAGLHIYFLLRALTLLHEGGRLAFIMPADTCEGKFAPDLWHWIAANFCLEAVVTFAPEASPFQNVDTNPIIFLIRQAAPMPKFFWARCLEPQTQALKRWVRSRFTARPETGLTVIQRDLAEGIVTGLSRAPRTAKTSRYVLGDFVQIVRGVATGANDFFFLTEEQIKHTGIPSKYFVRAIGRTRDVPSEEITQDTLRDLQAKARPTFLLALDGDRLERYPEKLKDYLRSGEIRGLSQRPLISQRNPWYKTESRVAPPFLFAYLGRRNSRFIRNTAGIIPLTCFLCVYPKSTEHAYVERLWKILRHPDTVANLALIGKSYGDGAVKVEPRSLEKLPIPENVIDQFGAPQQRRLFEDPRLYQATAAMKKTRHHDAA